MKENPVLSVNSFPSICRLCLCDKNLYSIKKICRKKVFLTELISTYASIQVQDDDIKPTNICKICENKMYTAHNFILNCKKSESLLNEIIIKNETVNKIEYDLQDEIPLIQLLKQEEKPDISQIKYECDQNDNDFDAYDDDQDDSSLIDNNTENGENVSQQETEIEPKKSGPGRRKGSKNKVHPEGTPKRRRQYSCKVCDEVFYDLASVKQHRIEFKHLRLKKHICPTCNKSFECNYRLNEHIRTHTGERPNVCDTCNKRFNSKSDLKRHVIIIHLNIKKYKCQYCEKGFSRKFYLRDHERTHTGERLYSSCCAKEFTSYYSLYHHEKKHKYNKKYVKKVDPNKAVKVKPEDEGNFPCYICPKILRTDYSLKRHIAVKHDIRNLTCDDCGSTYESIRLLNEHIRSTHKDHPYTIAHNIKEFSCLICAKQFKYKSSLRDHMRVHTGDTKFKCSECDKICLNKRKLNEHMRIHTGEKPYTCSYCGKSFRTLTNMTEHQKTHTGERNHMCAKCGKSFYDARSLKKHSATHDGHLTQL